MTHPLRLGLAATICVASLACSDTGEARDSTAPPPDPTFTRVDEGEALSSSGRTASVSDLAAPASPSEPWLAAGSVFDPDSRTSTAALWTSPDAATWERTDLPPDDPAVSEWFSGVVVHDGALLAVGTVGHGADGDAAVWRSDGDEWRRLEGAEMGGPGRQSAKQVVTNGRRVLVLGAETIDGDTRARLWLGELGGDGEDGAEWRAVDGGPGGVFDAEADETVTDIAALGDGFVAVGYRYRDGTSEGLAWVSDDGDHWERVEPTAPQPAQRWWLESVAVRDGAVVAGGTATAPGSGARAVTWTSDDARNWSSPTTLPVSGDARATPDGLWLDAVAGTADGWAAVAGGWDPHVWTSTDGTAWSLLPSPSEDRFPAGVDLVDVDAHSSTLVAVGSGPSVLRYDGQGWAVTEGGPFPRGGAVPFASAATVDGDTVIVGGGRTTPGTSTKHPTTTGAIWTRDPSGRWAHDRAGLTSGPVVDVAATAAGPVAVGVEQWQVTIERGGDAPGLDAPVWTRDDGWHRIGTDASDASVPAAHHPSKPPLGGPGNQGAHGVAPLAQGWLVAGVSWSYDDAGVWQADGLVASSLDGLDWAHEDAGVGGPGDISLYDVCTGPDGSAVAVGEAWDRATYRAVVRHRRPDGTWTDAGPAPGTSMAEVSHHAWACAAGDDGWIAVGAVAAGDHEDAAVWTSPDGITWTRLEHDGFGGPGRQRARTVVAVPGGGWLVGGIDATHGDDDGALWRIHPDGQVTRRDEGEDALGGPGDQGIEDLVVVGEGLVAVGDDHGRIGLWESPLIDRPS